MKRALCHVRSVQDMSLSMSGVTEAQTLIPPTRIVSRVTAKLEIIADGGICRATGRTKLARYSPTGHSLHCGLDARACGVAGLRSGSGQRKTNHALMSETSAGKPQREAIPLNI